MIRWLLTVAVLVLVHQASAVTAVPADGSAGLARAIRAANAAGGGGEVVLESGVYRLADTLEFAATNVTIRAAEKGGAVLSGAVAVPNWRPVAGKPWLQAKLAGVGYFRALIVNGAYAPRAEFPGGGRMLQNTNVWNVRWLSSIGNGWERAPTEEELATVFVKKGDLPKGFEPASADIRVYHDWDNSLVRVDKWLPEKLRLELKEPCRFPPGSFKRHGYIIYNTKEGMLEPGNWYFDAAAGILYYWPKRGETAENIHVEVPRLVKLLFFTQSAGVTFEGLSFANSLPPMQRSTFSGVGIDAAVTGRGMTGCAFRNCSFRNCGGIALRLADCADLRLTDNLFERSGSCALQVNGRGLAVVGNRLLSSGCVFTSACACNIGGRGVKFLSNEIDGAPYCGVVWGGRNNLFASNVVRNVMQSLHDGAAFYGMGAETVFRGNRVFDNQPAEKARHAFYFDEGGRDGLIVDNYVEGGFRTCVLNHFTYNIVVSNNVFRTPGDQTISFSGSRWGTCVNNRFECGGAFEPMPNACEIANWSGNVFLEKGTRRALVPEARPGPAADADIPVPYTAHAPGIDGWVRASDWPGRWTYAETAADGTSLHGTPRMFRACHDGTNLYLAARAPHYNWETPATNAAAADWVRFRFAGREITLRADMGNGELGIMNEELGRRNEELGRRNEDFGMRNANLNSASPIPNSSFLIPNSKWPPRRYAGIEKTAKKGMGWYMTYQAALPLAELGVSAEGTNLLDFDFAIHDALTGETRHHNSPRRNATPSVFRVEFPGRPPRWIDVLPMGTKSENPLADGVAYIFRLTPEGDPARDLAAKQVKDFKKLPGLKTGALLQCTLGHGGHPDKSVGETPWQKVNWKWKSSTDYYKFCPLDNRFRAYIVHQCRQIAALKPDFFMIDDDTRLEKGCDCPLHKAAYEKVKDTKSWAKFTEDTLADYVQLIRDCFPPEIPGMFCCVNATAQEGARMARIAAGPGHTPILRVGGAPYWEEKKFDMLNMRALYARERELVGDGGVALLMEADTCPHILARTSATRYTEFLQLVALEGYTGAKMWVTPTTLEKLGTEAPSRVKYKKALARDYPAIRYLTELGRAVCPKPPRIASNGRAVCPKPPDERGVKIVLGAKPVPFGVNDWGKSCLGRQGIAYRYGAWEKGDVVAVVGEEVKHFSDDELKTFVAGPLLLDESAAAAFAARGLGEAIKAKNVQTAGFTVHPYPQHYSAMKALTKAGKDEIIAKLRKLDGGYVPGRVYVADYGSYHLATGFDRAGARYVLIDNLDVDIPDQLTIVTPWGAEGLEELKDGYWQKAAITRPGPKGKGGLTMIDGPFLPHRPRIFRKRR